MWHEVGHRSDRATVPFRLPGPANPPTATVQLPRTEDDDEADLDEDAQVVDHAVDHDDEHLRVRVRVRARVEVSTLRPEAAVVMAIEVYRMRCSSVMP